MGGVFEMYDVLTESRKKKVIEGFGDKRHYNTDDADTPGYTEIDPNNIPMDATAYDVYGQLGNPSEVVPTVANAVGIPPEVADDVLYFDDVDFVFSEKTIGSIYDTVEELIAKTKEFMQKNPKYVRQAMSN